MVEPFGISAVTSGLNTVIKILEISYALKAVTAQTVALLNLVQHVDRNIREAKRLLLARELLLSEEESDWMHSSIADTEAAVRSVAKLLEPARVDIQAQKAVSVKTRAVWVFSDNLKAGEKMVGLGICHQTLAGIIASLYAKDVIVVRPLGAENSSKDENQRKEPAPPPYELGEFLNWSRRRRERSSRALRGNNDPPTTSTAGESHLPLQRTLSEPQRIQAEHQPPAQHRYSVPDTRLPLDDQSSRSEQYPTPTVTHPQSATPCLHLVDDTTIGATPEVSNTGQVASSSPASESFSLSARLHPVASRTPVSSVDINSHGPPVTPMPPSTTELPTSSKSPAFLRSKTPSTVSWPYYAALTEKLSVHGSGHSTLEDGPIISIAELDAISPQSPMTSKLGPNFPAYPMQQDEPCELEGQDGLQGFENLMIAPGAGLRPRSASSNAAPDLGPSGRDGRCSVSTLDSRSTPAANSYFDRESIYDNVHQRDPQGLASSFTTFSSGTNTRPDPDNRFGSIHGTASSSDSTISSISIQSNHINSASPHRFSSISMTSQPSLIPYPISRTISQLSTSTYDISPIVTSSRGQPCQQQSNQEDYETTSVPYSTFSSAANTLDFNPHTSSSESIPLSLSPGSGRHSLSPPPVPPKVNTTNNTTSNPTAYSISETSEQYPVALRIGTNRSMDVSTDTNPTVFTTRSSQLKNARSRQWLAYQAERSNLGHLGTEH